MNEFKPGLEGVVAFQTEIAEPDRDGGALRYRGVDIEELVGNVPYEKVWGLLVDENLEPGMPDPEPYEPAALTGNAPADLQSETARLSAVWKLQKLVDIDAEQARDDLARLSAQMMSIVAKSAAVHDGREPAPDDVVAQGETAAEKFLLRWRGEADPDHVKAIDTYWICTAEHGLNASTFTARITASTGADSRRRDVGGRRRAERAAARRSPCARAADARRGRAGRAIRRATSRTSSSSTGEIMGFGHRVYRAEDPRSRILKRTAQELGSPRFEVAEALEEAALAALHERKPDYVIATNVEFYSAVVLDVAEVPPDLTPAMFACCASRRLGRPHPRGEADRTTDQAFRAVHRACRAIAVSCLSWRQPLRREPRSRSRAPSASWRGCERSGRTSWRPRPARTTTANAPSRIGRSASSASGRRPSCFAAVSRTRARPVVARR